MTDFRALCAELVDNLDRYQSWYIEDNGYGIDDLEALLRRASATLAQPEPQGPTDEEIDRVIFQAVSEYMERESPFGGPTDHKRLARAKARAVLARWGNQ